MKAAQRRKRERLQALVDALPASRTESAFFKAWVAAGSLDALAAWFRASTDAAEQYLGVEVEAAASRAFDALDKYVAKRPQTWQR